MSFRWLYNSRREAPGDILCKKTSFYKYNTEQGQKFENLERWGIFCNFGN